MPLYTNETIGMCTPGFTTAARRQLNEKYTITGFRNQLNVAFIRHFDIALFDTTDFQKFSIQEIVRDRPGK